MASCYYCGKIGVMGRNVSHSKRHTPSRSLPNIQRHTIRVKGAARQVTTCTRCLRTQLKPATLR
ncbi:MAG: 50S ribosomal protein L28 [SAR202 cluster bacterium]|nr:50S ribosomal protein L28 [SAR202 cluster bacterium]